MKSITIELDDIEYDQLKHYSATQDKAIEETAGVVVATFLGEIAEMAVEDDDAIFRH